MLFGVKGDLWNGYFHQTLKLYLLNHLLTFSILWYTSMVRMYKYAASASLMSDSSFQVNRHWGTAGVKGIVLEWFKSYIKTVNCSYRFISNSVLTALSSVSQRSVLGSLLFAIYINNLFFEPLQGNLTAVAGSTELISYREPYRIFTKVRL